jgi:hypothetical protein
VPKVLRIAERLKNIDTKSELAFFKPPLWGEVWRGLQKIYK